MVVFPGTNCEHDVVRRVEGLGGVGELLWHGEASVGAVDAVVLPGGFAHGDYLRPGALARFSPVMEAVTRFARDGGPVVGICNGFQVLTEAGLLPGALQKNGRLRFLCQPVGLRVASTRSVLTGAGRGRRRAGHPHQPLLGELHLRRGDPAPAAGRRSHRAALPRQPQRLGRRHRRHRQRGGQRGRADAAPRAGLAPAAGLGGRAGAPALAARRSRRDAPAPRPEPRGRPPASGWS